MTSFFGWRGRRAPPAVAPPATAARRRRMIAPGVIPARTATAKLPAASNPCPQSGVAAVQVDSAGGVADHLRGRTRGRPAHVVGEILQRRGEPAAAGDAVAALRAVAGARAPEGLDGEVSTLSPPPHGRVDVLRIGHDQPGQGRSVVSARGQQGQAVLGANRVPVGDSDSAARRGLRVHLERGGGVQLAHSIGQGDADRRTEPRLDEVEPDRHVAEREVVLRDGRRLPRAPAQLGVQVSDPLRLGGPGELGDQVQRRRHAGGDRGRGRDRPVLDPAPAPHPVHRRPAFLQGADTRPVAGRVQAVEHPGLSEHQRPGTHAKDLGAVLMLGAHPVPQRGLGAVGGLAECGHDDEVGLQGGVGVDLGEGVGRHQRWATLQRDGVGVRGDHVGMERRGAGEDVVRRKQVAGDGPGSAGDERDDDRAPRVPRAAGPAGGGRRRGVDGTGGVRDAVARTRGQALVQVVAADKGAGEQHAGQGDHRQDDGAGDGQDASQAALRRRLAGVRRMRSGLLGAGGPVAARVVRVGHRELLRVAGSCRVACLDPSPGRGFTLVGHSGPRPGQSAGIAGGPVEWPGRGRPKRARRPQADTVGGRDQRQRALRDERLPRLGSTPCTTSASGVLLVVTSVCSGTWVTGWFISALPLSLWPGVRRAWRGGGGR